MSESLDESVEHNASGHEARMSVLNPLVDGGHHACLATEALATSPRPKGVLDGRRRRPEAAREL
jgi:hypothetical protein